MKAIRILIYSILLSCFLFGFKNKPQDDIFYSDLRPNKELRKGIVYKDTVKFVSYEAIGDYARITVSMNDQECYLLNDSEDSTLVEGDSIVIEWDVVTNNALEDPNHTWLDLHLIELKKLK
jgi:hypothetical protein